jgi:purine-binding chemotaxis protein CheW
MMNDPILKHASDLMPKDLYSKRILHDRAILVAKTDDAKIQNTEEVNYIKFMLNRYESYGISYQYISEVINQNHYTHVPCTADYVAGLINRRGKLMTLFDLKKYFGLPSESNGSQSSIIVLEYAKLSIGIIADRIIGSDSYDPIKLLENTAYKGTINSKYICGLHNSTTSILNIDNIITDLTAFAALEIGDK